jgi:hypothetical protein
VFAVSVITPNQELRGEELVCRFLLTISFGDGVPVALVFAEEEEKEEEEEIGDWVSVALFVASDKPSSSFSSPASRPSPPLFLLL